MSNVNLYSAIKSEEAHLYCFLNSHSLIFQAVGFTTNLLSTFFRILSTLVDSSTTIYWHEWPFCADVPFNTIQTNKIAFHVHYLLSQTCQTCSAKSLHATLLIDFIREIGFYHRIWSASSMQIIYRSSLHLYYYLKTRSLNNFARSAIYLNQPQSALNLNLIQQSISSQAHSAFKPAQQAS